MTEKKDDLSPFAALLVSKARKCHTFDVSGFFGMSDEPLAKVAIRVATKREQDMAVVEAWEYSKSLAGKDLQEAWSDRDILEDAKTACLLAKVLRDPVRPDEMPLFFTGRWMIEKMTVDQLSVLLNLYNTVKNRESPSPAQLDDDSIEKIAAACNLAAGTELPEQALAGLNREFLTQAVVLLSVKLAEARAAASGPVEHRED